MVSLLTIRIALLVSIVAMSPYAATFFIRTVAHAYTQMHTHEYTHTHMHAHVRAHTYAHARTRMHR